MSKVPVSAQTFELLKKHAHWPEVNQVCKTLSQARHEAWLAGGCVRDVIRGVSPKDIDVATSATPDQVEALFDKSIAVGKAFGVLIIPFNGFQVEVATFREDGPYKDGRRPESVRFSSPEEDAKRRDFTINALFMNPNDGLVYDFVGGYQDIGKKLIRAVGNPADRFGEDRLRMLRAVRFAAQLEFKIDPSTYQEIQKQAEHLSQVSRERIHDELNKLLISNKPWSGIEMLVDSKLLDPCYEGPFEHSLLYSGATRDRMQKVSEGLRLRWSAWLFDLNKDDLQKVLRRLIFSREDQRWIQGTIQSAHRVMEVLKMGSEDPEILYEHTQAWGADVFQLLRAIGKDLEPLLKKSGLQPGQAPAAWIRGDDLLKLGVRPGPQMNMILHHSYLEQLSGKLPNREAALAKLKVDLKA